MSSLADRMTYTSAAEMFLNDVPLGTEGAQRVLYLAALIAKDEGREVIRVGDVLPAFDSYMHRLGGGQYEPLWRGVEQLIHTEDDDDSH